MPELFVHLEVLLYDPLRRKIELPVSLTTFAPDLHLGGPRHVVHNERCPLLQPQGNTTHRGVFLLKHIDRVPANPDNFVANSTTSNPSSLQEPQQGVLDKAQAQGKQ